MNSKYHQILLMTYRERIEGVGMSTTENIDQRAAMTLLKGGHPIMASSSVDEYLAEVTEYVNHFKVIREQFNNKSREQAISYCFEHNLNFKEIRGEDDEEENSGSKG